MSGPVRRGFWRAAHRRIGRNVAARLATQLWSRLLSVALILLVARYEGPDGLGRYTLVLTVAGLVGAVTDLGLNTLLTREAARVAQAQSQRQLLGEVIILKTLLALSGVALMLLSPLLPFPGATRALLPLGGLLLLPEALAGAARALVNARQQMEVSGVIDMAARLLATVGAFLALELGYGISGVVIAAAVATAAGVGLYAVILVRWQLWPRLGWSVGRGRAILAESYPFAVTGIVAMAYSRADVLLLGSFLGEKAAGVYGAAFRLWEALGLIPASLLEALFPEMSRLSVGVDARDRLRAFYRRGTRWMAPSSVALTTVALAMAGVLVPLLGGALEYQVSVSAFRVLVCALPAMFLYLLAGHTLYALNQQKQVTAAMVAVAVANVALNALIIPRGGVMGASGVALLTAWLLWILLHRPVTRALRPW